jgi:hypothetical protein
MLRKHDSYPIDLSEEAGWCGEAEGPRRLLEAYLGVKT